MGLNNFNYSNVEKYSHNGKKKIRKIIIKGGKGHKSVTHYKNKKKVLTKKKLNDNEINQIFMRKFITGLFSDCCKSKKNKDNNNNNKNNKKTRKI